VQRPVDPLGLAERSCGDFFVHSESQFQVARYLFGARTAIRLIGPIFAFRPGPVGGYSCFFRPFRDIFAHMACRMALVAATRN
jgi:hypothetical protein